ncbi:hypothetical protein CsSME_00002782 [Camellia sinensis var. sinensis]
MSATSLSTYTLPELAFLRSDSTRRLKVSLSRLPLSKRNRSNLVFRTRIRAIQRDEVVFEVEDGESAVVSSLNGVEFNGNVNGTGYSYTGVVEGYSNGGTSVIESENGASNGSLAKYVNGNGAATRIAEAVVESESEQVGRKKTIEEIGQEEAWFKRSGQVEVSVTPGGRWNRFKTYSTIQRTLEIWGFVLTFIFKAWLNNQKFSYRGGVTEAKKVQRRKALAKWLKENILRLGPTFIKIGQQFSTRVDILAQEYVDQLSELQDQVPPFPSDTAISIVEEELGAPVNDIFERFDYEPIAAASLGQVHRAKLKGQEVVVKVQRPGLKDLFDIDLKNLRVIAEYLQKLDPKSDGAKRDWVAIYDECANVLYQHPGNIAVDDVNGGRLIFYDFGMMGSISPNIRGGLLETFYGVYEKDPDKVLQAMVQMGVLVPTGDMTAVRRTAQFFLNSFEERLSAQRKEREMTTAELGFKKPLSKEERIEKKKQRLAAIGEDLLAIAADQPFRFPATFTFVVRAFSVLDGIGKGLDPRFDITEIAKPYALELLRFREAGVEVIVKDFRKRWDRQSRAFYNLFRQADRVERLAEFVQRLEQGDLKLRVRALESERAFQRVAAVQKTIGSAVAAGTLINLGTILYVNSIRVPSMIAYMVCAVFGFQVLFGILKVKKLDQRERLITGTA